MEASPPPAAPERRPIEATRVISEAFHLYGQNFGALILTALIVFFAFGIVEALIKDAGGFFAQLIASIIHLIGVALFTGFVVKLVEDVRFDNRRDFSVGELVSAAMPAVGALIINSIFLGIAVGIGLILLIVPGLILLTIWAVCAPAIVAERRGAFEAFGRSHELVRGNGMAVFLTILLAFVIQFGIALIAGAIGVAADSLGLLVILGIVAAAITAPISALVSAVLFFDLGGGSASASDDRQVVVEY